MQIGKVKIKHPVIVAPMAGVSNGAFRELCYEFKVGLVYTEMNSDKAIFYKNKKTLDMLKLDDRIHPISLQLFGSDPKTMAYASKLVTNTTNCDIIDINMGCPVNKVIKTGAGSALMNNPDLAVEITKAVIDNTDRPVTVKMRLGYDARHKNCIELAKRLEEIGVSAICLHGRTRPQMYEGKADWSYIREMKDALNIPVIGNGDIRSLDDYIEHKNDCDAIMIGRALLGNPFLIKEINAYEAHKEYKVITYQDKIKMCLKHAKKLVDLKGEKVGIREMRGLAPHYISGLYNSTTYKNKMSKLNTYKELEDLLHEYQTTLKNKIIL